MQAEILRVEATEIQSKIEAKLASFDEASRAKRQDQIKLATAEELLTAELNDVRAKSAALAASFKPVKNKQLKHYPNPIAKTVFSEEIHFRLADGKLTLVPLEELLALMKDEWRLQAEQSLKTSNSTIETVGPLDGFRLQYQLSAAEAERGRAIRLDRFQVIPQPSLPGETVSVALAEGSRFRDILSRHEPRRTTVSIWLYPDGFSDHRAIKTWLYENGYQMASWPLEYGRHISGGPNGFKNLSSVKRLCVVAWLREPCRAGPSWAVLQLKYQSITQLPTVGLTFEIPAFALPLWINPTTPVLFRNSRTLGI